ncbi:MAG: LysR family transcriptional regulator [Enterobacteriaceae bacterium]
MMIFPEDCARKLDISRVNFRLLYYFKIVARERSFSRAAQRLNMSQPPLSLHIKELEKWLETPLLIRTTRSVELTPAGRALLHEVDTILNQVGNSLQYVRKLGRGESGHLLTGTVGTAAWGALLPTLQRFNQRFPEVSWSLNELNPQQQLEALQEHRIDIGISRDSTMALPEGIGRQLLAREQIQLAVAQQHRLAGSSSISVGQLSGEKFILLSAQKFNLGGYLYEVCRQYGVMPEIVHRVNEPQTALALVAYGYGITLLPESYGSISWPGVSFCPLTPAISANLYVTYNLNAMTSTVGAFLQMLAEEQGEN